ncbi:MAG: sugar phosphate nucleotidyltransferase [Planctomycetota bacterium]|nr:sugar phosphate nucleotidyltransferase [Sulfitobacter sp.]MDF1837568.1 sugar phosphate nucleotidyltransferase [Planctomycetota bacterium]
MTTLSKAVVLAAGAGSRMRAGHQVGGLNAEQNAAAGSGAKAMMPLGSRPFLDYVLHGLAEAGIQQVCLVVAPDHGPIRDHYASVGTQRLSIQFAVQAKPLGTAHAVLSAEDFAGSQDFLLINGDNHYPVRSLQSLCRTGGPALAAFDAESLLEDDLPPDQRDARLMAYSDVAIDDGGWLDSITEKPASPPRWVSMNCWRLGPTIFEACRAIEPSPRGELELPSAVLHSKQHLGQGYRALPATGPVLDLSSRADVLRVQARLASIEVSL